MPETFTTETPPQSWVYGRDHSNYHDVDQREISRRIALRRHAEENAQVRHTFGKTTQDQDRESSGDEERRARSKGKGEQQEGEDGGSRKAQKTRRRQKKRTQGESLQWEPVDFVSSPCICPPLIGWVHVRFTDKGLQEVRESMESICDQEMSNPSVQVDDGPVAGPSQQEVPSTWPSTSLNTTTFPWDFFSWGHSTTLIDVPYFPETEGTVEAPPEPIMTIDPALLHC
ncbi:hypothetical protein K474DRAFT_1770539 [Panus rudis PR-1116 ss-1]|nr:hypothetical protein K474DRAFT_1770539 [Panus rudis PR-1116 ss-1]